MSAGVHHFEDFELDSNAYRLSRNGEAIRLERIPLELLSLLVGRSNEVVTRDEILERIWGKDVYIDSENAINTAIRKIRRALKDDAESPRFIVTIPGKGYRFVAPVVIPIGHPEIDQNGTLPINGTSPELALPSAESAPTQLDRRRHRLRGLLAVAGLAVIAVAIALPYLLHRGLPLSASKLLMEFLPAQAPKNPSIAVLPFTNESGDQEQEYFSDGITDDLITDLSRMPGLFVIARESAFTYKGKPTRLPEVGRELGVEYVLQGSVRRSDGHVRITAQLANASTGAELWAERYDRKQGDVFALQDEIVRRIVKTLNLQLALSQQGVLIPRTTENLEAYDDLVRGMEYHVGYTTKGNEQARLMFQKAIELDPKYALAYALLGANFLTGWVYALDPDPNALEQGLRLEQQAIALDDSLAMAHSALAEVEALKGRQLQALTEAERGVALDPNLAGGYSCLADVLNLQGNHTAALDAVEKAMRLDPRNRVNYLQAQGWAYTDLGKWAKAIRSLKDYLGRYPDNVWARGRLAVAYSNSGDQAAAQAETAEIVRATTVNPNSAVGYWVLAFVLEEQGKPAEDLAAVNKAIRLDPGHRNNYSGTQGAAYTLLQRWKDAIPAFKRYLALHPGDTRAHAYLAVDYIELGHNDAARSEIAQALRLNPQYTVETVFPRAGLAHQALPAKLERFRTDLNRAGLD